MNLQRFGRGCLLVAAGTWLAGAMVGCESENAPAAKGDRPIVVCTTTMISDLARQIGGDRVQVIALMPSGVNPHTYESRPDDAIHMRKADLVLYNGLHLEGKMVHMFETAGTKAVALAEDERIEKRASTEYEGAPDPHCWWDVKNFIVYAERARDALISVDPDGRSGYKQRAAAYIDELRRLDAAIRAAVERIPAGRRYLITSHDAFYYYGAAYGLTVDAVLGISTDANVRPLRVQELVRLVVDNEVPAIFHETAVSASLNEMVNKVMQECRKKGHEVNIPDAPLYSDSLDEPGTPGDTYIGALTHNTRVIVNALAGEDVSDLLDLKASDDDEG